MDIKSYLIDFAEGKISVSDFIEYSKEHPETLDFLTNIADPKFKTTIVHKKIGDNGWPQYIAEELPFDAKLFINEQLKRNHGTLGIHVNIHGLFSSVLVTAFPNDNIVIDETLHNKHWFMLDACPEYIGGEEVDNLLMDLLETLPDNLSKTKKVKLYKEQLKSLFHIESNKYPRWIQEAEWPMGEDGIPMRFISQKRKKGKTYETMLFTEFLFEDVKTGKQRIVEQFT